MDRERERQAYRSLTRSMLALCAILLLANCVHGRSPEASGPRPAPPLGGLPTTVERELSAVRAALGPGYDLAQYGTPNPACWTAQNAPVKVRRRLMGAIESGAGWDTQLCLAEYERRGTHEDLLFKVYVFTDPTAPNRIVGAPYFQRKAAQLQTGGYPRMETAPRLLFYLTGSASNARLAWQVMPQWSARLRSTAAASR